MRQREIPVIMFEIPKRMQKVRLLANLKQEAASKMLGISQQAYSLMETSNGSMNLNTLMRFCKAFDVSIELLLLKDIPITEENIAYFRNHTFSYMLEEYRVMEQKIRFYESMIEIKRAS